MNEINDEIISRKKSFQAFVRDPDGYYIEFCNCERLDHLFREKLAEAETNWINSINKLEKAGKQLKKIAEISKNTVRKSSNDIKVFQIPLILFKHF